MVMTHCFVFGMCWGCGVSRRLSSCGISDKSLRLTCFHYKGVAAVTSMLSLGDSSCDPKTPVLILMTKIIRIHCDFIFIETFKKKREGGVTFGGARFG